ncbi:MAG: hypothetical protein ABFD83_08255 [Armatimonadota bacterium]
MINGLDLHLLPTIVVLEIVAMAIVILAAALFTLLVKDKFDLLEIILKIAGFFFRPEVIKKIKAWIDNLYSRLSEQKMPANHFFGWLVGEGISLDMCCPKKTPQRYFRFTDKDEEGNVIHTGVRSCKRSECRLGPEVKEPPRRLRNMLNNNAFKPIDMYLKIPDVRDRQATRFQSFGPGEVVVSTNMDDNMILYPQEGYIAIKQKLKHLLYPVTVKECRKEGKIIYIRCKFYGWNNQSDHNMQKLDSVCAHYDAEGHKPPGLVREKYIN